MNELFYGHKFSHYASSSSLPFQLPLIDQNDMPTISLRDVDVPPWTQLTWEIQLQIQLQSGNLSDNKILLGREIVIHKNE